MPGYSDRETDKALNNLIGEISSVYDDALSEVSKTASDYLHLTRKGGSRNIRPTKRASIPSSSFKLGRWHSLAEVQDGKRCVMI